MKDPENRLDEIYKISKAAGGLYTWVSATVNFYDVYKKVEPLKVRLDQMNKQKELTEEDLRNTAIKLAAL